MEGGESAPRHRPARHCGGNRSLWQLRGGCDLAPGFTAFLRRTGMARHLKRPRVADLLHHAAALGNLVSEAPH